MTQEQDLELLRAPQPRQQPHQPNAQEELRTSLRTLRGSIAAVFQFARALSGGRELRGCVGSCGGPRVHAELRVYVFEVLPDGTGRGDEDRCDLGVRPALGYPLEDLLFARRQRCNLRCFDRLLASEETLPNSVDDESMRSALLYERLGAVR